MPKMPASHEQRMKATHGDPSLADRRRAHDDRRGSAASRGYGSAWRRIRRWLLSRRPLCVACEAQGRVTPATEVDHVVPLRDGGTNDAANLQPLCKPCHSRKTATDVARRIGRSRGASPMEVR